MQKGRPHKPPADCPVERKYSCRSCWFWRDKCAYGQVIAEARAESGNLLTEDEARRRFPHIFHGRAIRIVPETSLHKR